MTNPSPGPSLVQARASELHPHSLIHRRRHDSTHSHHHHRHQRTHRSPSGSESGETAEQAGGEHEAGVEEPLAAAQEASFLTDANDLQLSNGVDPNGSSVDAVKGVDSSFPTGVGQNASPPPSDSTTSALYLRTAIETPEPLLAGSVLGNTVAITTPDSQATAATPAVALDIGSDYAASSSTTGSSSPVATTDTSTGPTTTDPTSAALDLNSSSQASDLTSTPSPSPSVYPTIGELHNGTNTIFNGNSSFVLASSAASKSSTHLSLKSSPSSLPSSNSSRHQRVSALSSPTTLSFTTWTDDPDSTTVVSTTTTQSDDSSITSASAPTSTSSRTRSDVTSTFSAGGFVATSVAGGASPNPSSGARANGGNAQDPELHRAGIIGGVCGSLAGVAFLAVLVLLALRYKKRRDASALLGGRRLGSTASGTLTGGDLMAMTQRSRISAVPVPFSSLTRKGNSHHAAASAEQGGETGFYRVAGRKLPPVLMTGGDGYSDPRESVMSGGSDYNRGSQAFDLVAAGSPRQLALGAPMRPVSGVPIMRSGPARTPVTENPFVDPLSPPPTQDTSTRRPVSRASVSKFHESI